MDTDFLGGAGYCLPLCPAGFSGKKVHLCLPVGPRSAGGRWIPWFGLHTLGNYRGQAENLLDNFLYGAPVFAPLLFVDLALLAAIGLWHLFSWDEQP